MSQDTPMATLQSPSSGSHGRDPMDGLMSPVAVRDACVGFVLLAGLAYVLRPPAYFVGCEA